MKAGPGPKNPGASIRARLGELARRKGVELQLLLSESAIERILYRLGASPHAARIRVQIDVGFGDAVVPAPRR